MIIVSLLADDKVALDHDVVDNLMDALFTELNRRPWHALGGKRNVQIHNNIIEIRHFGLATTNTDNNAALSFIMKDYQLALCTVGLKGLIGIARIGSAQLAGDKILPPEAFKPNFTKNHHILEPLIKEECFPQEFKCQMSEMMMDEPVYTKYHPDVRYNRAHLIYWLYTHEMKDPLCRQVVDIYEDVKDDFSLKDRISTYVHQQLKERLYKRNEEFIAVMKKYDKSIITAEDIEAAFRRASAEDNVEDMKILMRRSPRIDIQDENPINKRTALHWAIFRESINAIRYLLSLNAKIDIKDAKDKTAYEYALESTNITVKEIIKAHKTGTPNFEQLTIGTPTKRIVGFQ